MTKLNRNEYMDRLLEFAPKNCTEEEMDVIEQFCFRLFDENYHHVKEITVTDVYARLKNSTLFNDFCKQLERDGYIRIKTDDDE